MLVMGVPSASRSVQPPPRRNPDLRDSGGLRVHAAAVVRAAIRMSAELTATLLRRYEGRRNETDLTAVLVVLPGKERMPVAGSWEFPVALRLFVTQPS